MGSRGMETREGLRSLPDPPVIFFFFSSLLQWPAFPWMEIQRSRRQKPKMSPEELDFGPSLWHWCSGSL